MTDQVTTIGIGVDSSQVNSATTALDNMAKAGLRAESASSRLEKAHAAMISELRGIKAAISDLGALTNAEGRAAEAVKKREKASAAAALASLKATQSLKAEAKAIADIGPAATQGAAAMQKLSQEEAGINSNAIKKFTSDLSAAAAQAARTANAISSIGDGKVSLNPAARPAQSVTQQPTKTQASSVVVNSSAFQKDQAKSLEAIARASANIKSDGLKSISAELSNIANQAAKTSNALGALQSKASTSIKSGGNTLATAIPVSASGIKAFVESEKNAATASQKLTYSIKNQVNTVSSFNEVSSKGIQSTIASIKVFDEETRHISKLNNQLVTLQSNLKNVQSAQGASSIKFSSSIPATAAATIAPPVSRPSSASQIRAFNSEAIRNAGIGVPKPAALAGATSGTKALAAAQALQAKEAGRSAYQTLQLSNQLQDFFIQVQGGQGILRPLIQQGSQIGAVYGGFGNALRSITALLTPARLAIGGAAAAVGALSFAFIKAREEGKAFAEAFVLTGNAAGQTEAKVNALSRKVADSTSLTFGQVKDAAQAVAASGLFSPDNFNQATEGLALYARANKKTASEVIEVFEQIARDPVRAAEKLNERLHFLTLEQYNSIKGFDDQNNKVEASKVAFDALIQYLIKFDGTMDGLDRALNKGSKSFSDFWAAAKAGFGIGDDVAAELEIVEAAIQKAKKGGGTILPGGIVANGNLNDLLEQRRLLRSKQNKKDADAADAAKKADEVTKGIDFKKLVDSYAKAGRSTDILKEKTDELKDGLKFLKDKGIVVSEETQKAAFAGVQKQFGQTTPKGRSGAGEANQTLRAELEADLRKIDIIFAKERDRISFNERFLQGEYQAGRESLVDLYKGKREAIQQGVDAEIKALEDENKRLNEFLGKIKDQSEHEQTKGKIANNEEQIDRARLNAARDQKLLNQEEAASFKQLDDSISNYRANLLQLQGDEEGAAKERAKTVIENARVLSAQSVKSGRAPVDVNALAQAISIQDQFNEVQRKSQILATAARTAEDAFAVAAEQRGLSQKDADTGVYLIRQKELDQLGQLAQKAKELADASTDPKIKQFAAELAVEYAKAAAAVDPALQRLRDANKQLAQELTQTITNLPTAFAQAYSKLREDANQNIKNEKDEYSRRIDILEGYLAESQDKQDKARLRAKIKDLEAQKSNVKKDSRASSLFKAFNESFVQPAAQQVIASVSKLVIADPLQKFLENQLKGLTEGDGPLAGFFKDALGIKDDPKQLALDAQTASVIQSTSALDLLTQAAQSAAAALPSGGQANPANPAEPTFPPSIDSELPGLEFDGIEQANDSSLDLAKTVPQVTNVLTKLAGASSSATSALSILPSIISLISSTAGASSASSGLGSLFGSIAGAFSGGSSGGSYYGELFHEGGIVGSPTTGRMVSPTIFAGAQKYHSGGIAGKKADKVLAGLQSHEVPAILMGGPKGKREEVLKANDPRHRDNLGMTVLAAIMKESKHKGLQPRGARAMGGDVSSNSLYRVNESRPELLQVAGKQYLMTGNQAGHISPKDQDNGRVVNQTININTGGQPVDRRTTQQIGAAAHSGARRAAMRNN